ncbi:UNVERIFIED_CONTAM: hypothetical protein Sindi_2671800 [Sesamum indicum]
MSRNFKGNTLLNRFNNFLFHTSVAFPDHTDSFSDGPQVKTGGIGRRGFNLQSKRQEGRMLEEEKGQGKAVAATASASSIPNAPVGKGKRKVGSLNGERQMMSASISKERGIGRESAHNSSPTQVLERSRILRKDEMILRLGNGKAVAAEVMGSLNLVISDHIQIELKDCSYVPSIINILFSFLF